MIYWALMKTQSRAFRTSDWADGSPSNRTMNLNTQQEWFKGNSVNVFELPSHSLGLNSIKYFWRNLKMCICPRDALIAIFLADSDFQFFGSLTCRYRFLLIPIFFLRTINESIYKQNICKFQLFFFYLTLVHCSNSLPFRYVRDENIH